MHTLPRTQTLIAAVALSGALAFIAGCAPMASTSGTMASTSYALSGSFEVPPVTTTVSMALLDQDLARSTVRGHVRIRVSTLFVDVGACPKPTLATR